MNFLTKLHKTLKHLFIPHDHNQNQPHILRTRATILIIALMFAAEAVFLVQIFVVLPNTNFLASVLPSVLVALANNDRKSSAAGELTTSSLLEQAAQMKADDMALRSYFSHTDPDGALPWKWFKQVGYTYKYAGENLAINFVDSEDIEVAWMNSPKHRENLLNGSFTEVGIGTAKGVYEGRDTIFVVQFFGKPATAVASPAPALAVETPTKNPQPVKQPVPPVSKPVATSTVIVTASSSTPTSTTLALGVVEGVATSGSAEKPSSSSATTSSTSVAVASVVPIIPAASIGTQVKERFLVAISSPHHIANYFFWSAMSLAIIALIFKVFIRIRIQYTGLILNGIAILFVAGGIFFFNSVVAVKDAKVAYQTQNDQSFVETQVDL